jgi:hypothetical protein
MSRTHVTVKIRTERAFADRLRTVVDQAAASPDQAAAVGIGADLAGWLLEIARAIESTPPSSAAASAIAFDPSMPLFLRRQAE